MHCHNVLFLLFLVQISTSFKFLAFSPQFAVSHANFLGKISDTLVDAGHEVVSQVVSAVYLYFLIYFSGAIYLVTSCISKGTYRQGSL